MDHSMQYVSPVDLAEIGGIMQNDHKLCLSLVRLKVTSRR